MPEDRLRTSLTIGFRQCLQGVARSHLAYHQQDLRRHGVINSCFSTSRMVESLGAMAPVRYASSVAGLNLSIAFWTLIATATILVLLRAYTCVIMMKSSEGDD